MEARNEHNDNDGDIGEAIDDRIERVDEKNYEVALVIIRNSWDKVLSLSKNKISIGALIYENMGRLLPEYCLKFKRNETSRIIESLETMMSMIVLCMQNRQELDNNSILVIRHIHYNINFEISSLFKQCLLLSLETVLSDYWNSTIESVWSVLFDELSSGFMKRITLCEKRLSVLNETWESIRVQFGEEALIAKFHANITATILTTSKKKKYAMDMSRESYIKNILSSPSSPSTSLLSSPLVSRVSLSTGRGSYLTEKGVDDEEERRRRREKRGDEKRGEEGRGEVRREEEKRGEERRGEDGKVTDMAMAYQLSISLYRLIDAVMKIINDIKKLTLLDQKLNVPYHQIFPFLHQKNINMHMMEGVALNTMKEIFSQHQKLGQFVESSWSWLFSLIKKDYDLFWTDLMKRDFSSGWVVIRECVNDFLLDVTGAPGVSPNSPIAPPPASPREETASDSQGTETASDDSSKSYSSEGVLTSKVETRLRGDVRRDSRKGEERREASFLEGERLNSTLPLQSSPPKGGVKSALKKKALPEFSPLTNPHSLLTPGDKLTYPSARPSPPIETANNTKAFQENHQKTYHQNIVNAKIIQNSYDQKYQFDDKIHNFIGLLFYDKLLYECPLLKRIFVRSKLRYGEIFIRILSMLLKYVDEPHNIWRENKILAIKHLHFGVRAQDIKLFGIILMNTLADIAKDKFTDEMRKAWRVYWYDTSFYLTEILTLANDPITRSIILKDHNLFLQSLEKLTPPQKIQSLLQLNIISQDTSPFTWCLDEGDVFLTSMILKNLMRIYIDRSGFHWGQEKVHQYLEKIVKNNRNLVSIYLDSILWKSSKNYYPYRRINIYASFIWPSIKNNFIDDMKNNLIHQIYITQDQNLLHNNTLQILGRVLWGLLGREYFIIHQIFIFLMILFYFLGFFFHQNWTWGVCCVASLFIIIPGFLHQIYNFKINKKNNNSALDFIISPFQVHQFLFTYLPSLLCFAVSLKFALTNPEYHFTPEFGQSWRVLGGVTSVSTMYMLSGIFFSRDNKRFVKFWMDEMLLRTFLFYGVVVLFLLFAIFVPTYIFDGRTESSLLSSFHYFIDIYIRERDSEWFTLVVRTLFALLIALYLGAVSQWNHQILTLKKSFQTHQNLMYTFQAHQLLTLRRHKINQINFSDHTLHDKGIIGPPEGISLMIHENYLEGSYEDRYYNWNFDDVTYMNRKNAAADSSLSNTAETYNSIEKYIRSTQTAANRILRAATAINDSPRRG